MNHQDKQQYLRYLGVRAILQGKCILLAQQGFPVPTDCMENVVRLCCEKSTLSYKMYKEFEFAERLTTLYFEQKSLPSQSRVNPLHDEIQQVIFDQYLTGKRTNDFSRCSFDVFITWFLQNDVSFSKGGAGERIV
jgi:hypothetical protein